MTNIVIFPDKICQKSCVLFFAVKTYTVGVPYAGMTALDEFRHRFCCAFRSFDLTG
jgi:hypothetical protein